MAMPAVWVYSRRLVTRFIMKKALFVAGGWSGHSPEKIVRLFAGELNAHGVVSDIETTLDVFADAGRLRGYDLIFLCWTMGTLTKEQSAGLRDAVRGGV